MKILFMIGAMMMIGFGVFIAGNEGKYYVNDPIPHIYIATGIILACLAINKEGL